MGNAGIDLVYLLRLMGLIRKEENVPRSWRDKSRPAARNVAFGRRRNDDYPISPGYIGRTDDTSESLA